MFLDSDIVWGISTENKVLYRNGINGSWDIIDRQLKKIDIGKFGVFGIDLSDNIVYRIGTHENPYDKGTAWQM